MRGMAARSQPGVCPDCGGPSLTYKGHHHAWRCTACIGRYLAEGAAKADSRLNHEREQRIAKAKATTTINTLTKETR
jgi:ribosomal protein L37AE/L43A